MVNTYAVQWGGCRFESLWGFGFFLKGAHYEVDYCGKKTNLAGLQCTLTSSCAKRGDPLGFFNIHSVANYRNNWRGANQKILKSHNAENSSEKHQDSQKGDP